MASSEGCGRFRWKVASLSPLTVTSVTFSYQSLRGFFRNLSSDFPISLSQVHFTSLAEKGFPSCHFTPSRKANVSLVLSSFQDQLVSRSGTIVSRLFCALCWSYITRLLKTGIIGTLVENVASS